MKTNSFFARVLRLAALAHGGPPAAVLAAILVFVATLAAAQQSAAPPASQQADYVVGPQDVLSITVWDQADLSGKFTVETDGSFTFPLIGRLQVGGLTLRQVENELKKRLSDGYFKNPQLTVAVDTYKSQRVFIVGEVRSPGTYTLTGDMSLIEALSRAGSTTPTAGTEAIIVHPTDGKSPNGPVMPGQANDKNTVRVDLKDLQSGAMAKNVALKDGDTIFVPRAETIYVFGQVKNPGAYALQTKDTTVLQALSLAGGVTDRGSTSRIKIVRLVKGKKTEIKVDLGDSVLPGDTVIVPERFF
ncbi:MAG TPA: polysaccharide biosynthesis/export family protein [Vicinamibacterales bacterium]|jgi:polysaccharide export outer membrane protein